MDDNSDLARDACDGIFRTSSEVWLTTKSILGHENSISNVRKVGEDKHEFHASLVNAAQ